MNELRFEGKTYELIPCDEPIFTNKSDGHYDLNFIKTEESGSLSSPYQTYSCINLNGKYYAFEQKWNYD